MKAKKIKMFLQQCFCRHEFKHEDLKINNAVEPLKEPDDPKDTCAWLEYFDILYTHESNTKRIQCQCCKCHKIFYERCGMYLVIKYGRWAKQGQ